MCENGADVGNLAGDSTAETNIYQKRNSTSPINTKEAET